MPKSRAIKPLLASGLYGLGGNARSEARSALGTVVCFLLRS